ncbi:MAG: galactokinase, partial [Chitinophagaceae bacterium]
PGRINLIGEHTDYNDGFVLPASIDKYAYVAVQKRNDEKISLYSIDFEELHEASLNDLSSPGKHWPVYILGVVDQLHKAGFSINGFNLVICGTVPIGAGMSSSAAVECATVFALNELFGLSIAKIGMVKMAQKAEHKFAGVKCGIMDQFASMFGKSNQLIRLDCRSLEFEYVPFLMKGIKIVLLDTNVKHSLASSAYNERRMQCEKGVEIIQQYQPQVKSLRDADMKMLDKYVLPFDELVYRRCKYVVEEIERTTMACNDLKNDDIISFGKKMFETHEGLSTLYEVSCAELDFLISQVKDNPDVPGARMMGGGFGGCTINLIKEEVADDLIEKIFIAYEKELGRKLNYYHVSVEDGTSIVNR